MSRTYEAVLDGDHLEWKGSSPKTTSPIDVTVEVPDEADLLSPEERRRRRDAAQEKLRAMGGIKSIPDPVAWQREMRKDKPLAGRDE